MCDVHFMNRKQTSLILAMATVIQLPLLFIGIDLADTGQYMTFYEQIFDAPGSVEYHFIYYLSGILGGAWYALWPGIFSLRVLGLLCNLWAVWILTRIIRDWRPVSLAVAVVLSGWYVSPMTFYYDTLTVTLAMTGVWLMVKGGDRSRIWLLLGGIVMGINVFSRLSNLSGIIYVLFFFIAAIWRGKRMMCGAVWYSVGWFIGVGLVLLLMALLGHIGIFADSMGELLSVARATGDEATHGMENLIAVQFNAWWRILKFIFVEGVLLLAFLYLRRKYVSKAYRVVFMLPVALMGVYVVFKSSPVTFAAGVGLAGSVAVFFNCRDRNLWECSLAGLLMLFIIPLGADGGIYNCGTIATWLSLAVAMTYFSGAIRSKKHWLIPGYRASMMLTLAFGSVMVFNVARNGIYFDGSNIDDRFAKVPGELVYTSRQRKELIEDIVSELNNYVEPGDTLMVYGSAPMFNYLTHTRPWIGCSWPESTTKSYIYRHLKTAEGHPMIVIVKFDTLGPAFGIPSDDFGHGGGNQHFFHNRIKSGVVYDFLEHNDYRPVYNDEYIVVYKYRADAGL